jgi:hypothetical protein
LNTGGVSISNGFDLFDMLRAGRLTAGVWKPYPPRRPGTPPADLPSAENFPMPGISAFFALFCGEKFSTV